MNSWVLKAKNILKETAILSAVRRYRFNKQLYDVRKAEKVLDYYRPGLSKGGHDALLQDMLQMARQYRFTFDEFFLFQFEGKTIQERLEFIPDLERIDIVESLNRAKNQYIFDDKRETYRKFSKFYKRDVVLSGGYSELLDFLIKYKRCIVKPVDGTCGQGVRFVECGNDPKKQIHELNVSYRNGYIMEEVIKQNPEMARFHPESVNTVRIPTIRSGDRVRVVIPFMRTGRGNSIVDNAGAGGIICALDVEEGIIVAAADEHGNSYEKHPDTGERLIGFKVPRWNEAKRTAIELAGVVPDNCYAGWDLALTENGWALVEANARGQFLTQIATKKGFRKELNLILKK